MVERGNLVAATSPTGEVYAPRQVELSFDVSKIQLIELNVTPGQKVKTGDVLARIDSAALERAVLQAEADLTVAQDNLEKTQNPYTELDLIQARLTVSQAEIALEDAKENLEEPYTELDLIQARLTVSQTEIALEVAKGNLATLLNPYTGAAWAAVQNAAAALEIAKSQLTVAENSTDNAAKIRTLQDEAEWFRRNHLKAIEKFEKGEINQQKLDWEYLNMVAAEEKLLVAQTNAEISLTNARNKVTQAEETLLNAQTNLAARQSGPDALELFQAEVQVTQAEYNLAEALESLAEIEAGPDPKELLQAEVQVAQAEYNLAEALESLAEIEAGPDPRELARAEIQVAQAEHNLAKAREALAEVEAGPDPKEIEMAQAKVVSARTTLEEAQAALEAATMIAPFDGTVISVGAEVGDLVSSNTVVVALTDLSNLRVLAIVDETDIGLVEIGHEAEITFDAFPGHRFSGQVLEVPLQGSLVQNVLTYEVPVSLEGAASVALKPGMTANLKIVVGRRQNALLVPAMAVQQGEEGNVVLVQDTPQGPGVATPVQVGLSDGMYVEVVSGLIEGDRVVVEYQPVQAQPGGIRGLSMPGAGGLRQR